MIRDFMIKYVNSISIIVFIFLFYLVQLWKPGFLYNRDGSIRQFGLGHKKKTIIPLWMVALILAMCSYIAIRYFINNIMS